MTEKTIECKVNKAENVITTIEKIISREDLQSENYSATKEEIIQIESTNDNDHKEFYKPVLALLDKIYDEMQKEEN